MSKENNIVAVDFETAYDSEYSLSKMSVTNYVKDPRFDAYLVSINDGEDLKYIGRPEGFSWDRLDGMIIAMHNASFDYAVLARLVELGKVPRMPLGARFVCTADLAAWLGVKRDLKTASLYLLGEEVSKSTRAAMKGKASADLVNDADVLKYAGKDAELCYRLAARYLKDWPENEQRISELNREAGIRGIHTDAALVNAGIASLEPQLQAAMDKIPWVKDGDKPLSPNALRRYGQSVGIPVPASLAKDNPDFLAWAEEYSEKFPWVKAVGEYRSINALLCKVQSISSGIDPATGMFPFGIKYMGAACLTGDHEVLTRTGWVRLDTWGGGDIMQWSPDSMDFMPAKQNVFTNTDDAMVLVDAPFYKACMTLGHTVPIYRHGARHFGTLKAGELTSRTSGTYMPVSGVSAHTGALTPEQMRVLAATQADGSYEPRQNGRACLHFAMRKPRKIRRLQEILAAAGVKFYGPNRYPSSKNSRISIRGEDLPSWLHQDRKVFGSWLLDSTKEARAAFIEELVHWDGCPRGPYDKQSRYAANIEYGSVVLDNVAWVATIAHISGMSVGRIHVRAPRGNRKPFHRVILRRSAIAMPQAKHVTLVPSSVVVYCPTATTGFFMFRYKGVIGITGNTGRFSGGSGEGGGRVNLQNLPRKPMFGVDVRPMFMARPGHTFITADYAQIEARYLLWLAGDEAALAPMRAGKSVYQAAAEAAGMCEPGYDLKHKDPHNYQLIKSATLGAGYQAAGPKFRAFAKTMGLELTEEQANETIAEWRRKNWRVVQLWREHQDALAYSARRKDDTHQVQLRSGRVLTYWEPRACGREISVYQTRGDNRSYMYGGKLTENEVQASCRDILTGAWLAVDKAALPPVTLTVHDEIVMEVKKDEAAQIAKELERLMVTCSQWAEGLPLGVDVTLTDRYTK